MQSMYVEELKQFIELLKANLESVPVKEGSENRFSTPKFKS